MWRHVTEKETYSNKQEEPDLRWAGPVPTAYPANMTWKMIGGEGNLGALTIKKLTQFRTYHKMKPPPAVQAWEERIGNIRVEVIVKMVEAILKMVEINLIFALYLRKISLLFRILLISLKKV